MVTDLAPRPPPLPSVKVGTNENSGGYSLYLPIIIVIIGAANRKNILKGEVPQTVCSTTPTWFNIAYSISWKKRKWK
jgi:hypothetical protein